MESFFGDISFLNSAGLWGLASLAIPLIIHLFNRSRGKRKIVGSIALIKQAKITRVTEIKLAQYILLFIRLCLFAIAAFVLADMARRGAENRTNETVYLTSPWVHASSDEDIKLLAETQGVENIFIVGREITPFNDKTVQGIKADNIVGVLGSTQWASLVEKLETIRHLGPVHVYSTNLQGQYPNQIPLRNMDLNWHLKNIDQVEIPTIKLSIALIVNNKNSEQVRHITGAIKRLNEQRNIKVSTEVVANYSDINGDKKDLDWVVWLSGQPNNVEQLSGLKSRTKLLRVWENTVGQGTITSVSLPHYPFTKFDVMVNGQTQVAGTVIGETDNGRPLVLRTQQNGFSLYHLVVPLTSAATTLVGQPDFPIALLSMLLGDEAKKMRDIFAPLTPSPEMLDAGIKGEESVSEFKYPASPLHNGLMVLMLLLFVAERWYSERVANDPA